MRKLLTGLILLLLVGTFMVGCEREVTETIIVNSSDESNCFSCHNDNTFGLLFVAIQDQYEYSTHASGNNTNRNRIYSSRYSSCERCHSSEGFIAEVTGEPASGEHFSAIGCFTCHASHTDGNFGVRVTAAVTLEDSTTFDRGDANLCATCHKSRRDVNTYVVDGVSLSSHWSPHYSNQGDMLMGTNAYEYATYSYSSSAHTNVVADGCIGCHMSPALHSSVGGHSWNMENEDRGFENLEGCNVSTCHDGDVSSFDYIADANNDFDWSGTTEGSQTEIHGLLDSLLVHLVAAGLADVDGTPISITVPNADSAGALYNFLFVEDDHSLGTHNTDYAVGLLQSSINYLNTGNPNGVPANNTNTLSAHK